jgi:uncharacterized OB-fold protein
VTIDQSIAPLAELLPNVTELNKPFWQGLLAGEVRLQRCKQCGKHQFPPESFCYQCPSTELEWVVVPAHGEVYSFIVVHQRYHPAFTEHLPYVVATIQLDEGPRMLGAIFDPPESIQIGSRVQPRIERVSEAAAVLLFTAERPS